MCQIITQKTNHPTQAIHGWLVYTAGDSGIHPRYLSLYEAACEKRGMSVAYCLYDPGLLSDEAAAGRLREQLTADVPAFVINRTRDYRLAEFLEAEGIRVYNSSKAARLGNDKAQAYRYMQRRGIPVMPTCYDTQEPPRWYPAVVKSCGGHGGTEVFFIRDEAQWKEWKWNEHHRQKEQYVVQQAASCLGRDVRVYIVGNQITAAVLRTSETDFRSNYCLGGSVELYRLSVAERELVQRAVRGLSIGMAGIDFVFHQGQMVFNEIEDMAGARGLYSLTDYDIVDDYMRFIQEELCHDTGQGTKRASKDL